MRSCLGSESKCRNSAKLIVITKSLDELFALDKELFSRMLIDNRTAMNLILDWEEFKNEKSNADTSI